MKRVTILGSTGSVGINTLDVIRRHSGRFKVAGLSAATNATLLEEQIRLFRPEAVYLKDRAGAQRLKARFPKVRVYTESDKIHSFSAELDADILVAASTGTSGLLSVLGAIRSGRRVALANKEILVMAGSLVMKELSKNRDASLIPVDSEHSAIFQCLQGEGRGGVKRLYLTGSGGPLRQVSAKDFKRVTKEQVINHPKWKMGRKISVDSATLMNKGLEIIEAAWLFDVPVDRIEVVIHPEAIVHSMVEFKDGSLMAQMGVTDMRLPIQYALSYPERLASAKELFLAPGRMGALHFDKPDTGKFPCLALAYEAARLSGSAPCVLSAADEVAVAAYLDDKIPFVDIPKIIENVLTHHRRIADPDLAEIQGAHDWAVERTSKLCKVR